jgi:hypothetical protein|tara:strand:- start:241 stop:414 length:174 start_codon:yes stop_codon:yes gene_type:complete
MKFDRESLKKVLNNHGYTPMQFDQQWYEFALLLIIAENTTPKNNLTVVDLNTGDGSQ